MSDREKVFALSTELRSFLEIKWGGPPGGRCSSTSPLVAAVLNDAFAMPGKPPPWNAVQGNFQTEWHQNWHCWCTNGELIVDLTADQFNGRCGDVVFDPVVVAQVGHERYLGHGVHYNNLGFSYYEEWKLHRRRQNQERAEAA